MAVPYTFSAATAAIPLSQLDSNFASTITLGNTAIQLGNTVTILNNMTFANVTISSGSVTITDVSVSGNVTISGGTANGVAYLNSSKVLTTGTGLVFDGTNLGLGVTPSGWTTNYRALQLKNNAAISNYSGTDSIELTSNAYAYADNAWKYLENYSASRYTVGGGAHQWYVAPSGTAGNAIAFTQAMTLDANGKLLVGNTSSISTAGLIQSAASNATTVSNTYLWNSADTGIALKNTSSTTNSAIGLSMFGGASGNSAAAVLMVQETANSLGALVFYTGGSGRSNTVPEAGRFDSSGNLLVGTTSVNFASSGFTLSSNAGTTKWLVGPYASAPNNFYVASSGSTGVYLNGTSATSWSSNSDERLKTDLLPIENAATKVASLRAVTGRYKTDPEGTSRAFLIAQDVQAVLPEAVAPTTMYDGTEVLGLAYTETIPLLVAAIQELKAELDTAKEQIAALQGAAK